MENMISEAKEIGVFRFQDIPKQFVDDVYKGLTNNSCDKS